MSATCSASRGNEDISGMNAKGEVPRWKVVICQPRGSEVIPTAAVSPGGYTMPFAELTLSVLLCSCLAFLTLQ